MQTANFTDYLTSQLDKLSTQVQSLSENDLIINSLIDFTNRDDYLPVFFGSIKPAALKHGSKAFSIVFTDFEGEAITGNNIAMYTENETLFNWKEDVLENSKAITAINKNGIFIAFPVLYGQSTEGAIALFIRNLDDLLDFKVDDYNVIVRDQGEVIYSANNLYIESTANSTRSARAHTIDVESDKKDIPSALKTSAKLDLGSYQHLESDFKNLTIHILEPYSSAYKNVAWVVFASLLVFALIVLGTSYSIQLASRKAASIIKLLQHEISKVSEVPGATKKLNELEDEPLEIKYLRESFNTLMEDLFTTTFFKDRVEGVIDSLDEMLVVYDSNSNVMLHNSAFEAMCKTLECEIDDSANKIFPSEFIEVDPNKPNDEKKLEYTEHTNAKRIIHIDWRKTLYTDNKGNIVGTVLAGMDISSAVKLEKELTLKNKAVDEALTSIIIADASVQGFPITYVNKAFEKMTGYSGEELSGTSCKLLQGPDTDPAVKAKITSALSKLEAVTVTVLNYRKDGTPFYNRLSLSPIKDANQKVTHILGFQHDVTEQEKTTQYLEEAREQAESSARMKTEFLASMSHEIRTPMNGVLGMLGLLENSSLNQQQAQHVKLAKTSADSLLVLINDILDFSKVEAGKLTIENVEFDILNLLGEITGSLACTAEDKHLEIILDATNLKNRRVSGDPGRLRQVLNNLLGNAIKFTLEGHVLLKAYTGDNGEVIFDVVDTGVGIPESRLSSVFDSFSQVDASTTRKFGGTGLGLTICKQLAELMGGYVSVASKEGEGSVFTFAAQLEPITEESGSSLSQNESALSNISILLIDDVPAILEALSNQLNAWNVSTECANTPIEAIELVTNQSFDIVILDSKIPNTDCHALCAELLSASKNTSVKVAMLTSLSDLSSQNDFKESAVSAFIPKPVTPNDLFDVLKHMLSKESNELDPEYNAAPTNELNKTKRNISGQYVLLVEDNPINQFIAEALLEDLGINVTVANHGVEALALINGLKSERTPDFAMILMDCQMPEMDGYETTRQIRRGACGETYKVMPIVAMTANAIAGDREKCLECGMDDYMSKPIDTDILEQKLEEWITASPFAISEQPDIDAET